MDIEHCQFCGRSMFFIHCPVGNGADRHCLNCPVYWKRAVDNLVANENNEVE